MKEIRLTEIDRRTLACAISIFIDGIKEQEVNEKETVEAKTIALLTCVKIVDIFDLEEFMEEFKNVL